MPSTTDNGLPIPLDSDPVSDGALAVQQLAEALDAAAFAPWASYTSAWTAATTNPVIGNGTIVAAFLQAGHLVHFRVLITMGSTTTYGAGQMKVGLPVAAKTGPVQLVNVSANDSGANYMGQGRITSASVTADLATGPAAAGGQDRSVSATVPFTFATGDTITVCGTYEAG